MTFGMGVGRSGGALEGRARPGEEAGQHGEGWEGEKAAGVRPLCVTGAVNSILTDLANPLHTV